MTPAAGSPDDLVDGPGPLLPGRIAVITGGAAGIGAATAQLFAEHGATVVIADVDTGRSSGVVDDITSAGGEALAITTDVRSAADIEALRAAVLDRFGTVDVLVNNAGHWVRGSRSFLDEDDELWDELHEINFRHVVRMSHAFAPSMVQRGRGAIVNVSSVEGLRGYPPGPVYAAYKAAVVHFTTSLGAQLGGSGVRVNGIGPDVTDSLQVPYDKIVPEDQRHLWPRWVPAGRMGVARDQARATLFLASDLSSFLCGHTLPTDGGTYAAGGWFRTERRSGTGWTNRPVDP